MSATKTNDSPGTHILRIGLLILLGILVLSGEAMCETYGIKDAQGNFVPKVTMTISGKELIIKKTDPQDKFRSFALILNSKNRALIMSVGQINIEWIDATNKASKPVPFAGTLYNAATRTFQDSLTKSLGVKLVDKTTRNLFSGKSPSDLLTVQVDDQVLLSSETVTEKDRTVQLGTGRDVSLNIEKSSIVFNESNFKKGEILNVDNRSGLDQVLGVELPEKGLLYFQIIKKPEQEKIKRENWDRFTLAADSGIFIVLIPEPDAAQLAQLDGKDIVIKVYQGTKVRETRKIPIKIAADLRNSARDLSAESRGEDINPPKTETPPARIQTGDRSGSSRTEPPVSPDTSRKDSQKVSTWLWAVQIFNLIMLAGLGVYALFFMMPKIQVLEDRLAKNEMFVHGSREALREEMDQLKEELIQQRSPTDAAPE
ncbi:MAG TPA: hypothetical protein VK463_04915 [Desulfomonilaceae bacterium]|nr:hypothetical protein [Desulfomonilaceae bacterium]